MLAHRLPVGPRQLRSQSANAVIELLDLRLAQDGSGGLRLESVDQRREEVDILRLDRRELIVVLGERKWGSGGSATDIRSLLLQYSSVSLLLLLHISKRRRDRRLQIVVVVLQGFGCLWGPPIRLWRARGEPIGYRRSVSPRVALDFLQAHCKRLLQVFVEPIIDPCIARLHVRAPSLAGPGIRRIGRRTLRSTATSPLGRLVGKFRITSIVNTNGRKDP